MSHSTGAPLSTYRNETAYPFCSGCGHGPILDRLNEALVSLQVDPSRVVIVSDIGCSGLSDQYFATSAFHGLHGRSITYASGIKLVRPDLEVIVIMGDGGTGIGGTHLLNAARRNMGITVLVMNNFNFGMTGGQHSTTTPPDAVTSTTPEGNLERPLDICATVATNGAGYVYRGTSFDADLSEHMAKAINSEGFSLLDIWELCTAWFVPRNKLSRKTLGSMMEQLGFEAGVIAERKLPEYAAAYRQACVDHVGAPHLRPRALEPTFEPRVDRQFNLVVAGSAGGKVRTAVRLVAEAAILSGLWAAQRDDYPVTVKTGHSVSELILGPDQIQYTGIERPHALVILSEDGLKKATHHLAAMNAKDRVFVLPHFAGVKTAAPVEVIDPASSPTRIAPTAQALFAMAAVIRSLGIMPEEALEEAARGGRAAYAQEQLATVRAALTSA